MHYVDTDSWARLRQVEARIAVLEIQLQKMDRLVRELDANDLEAGSIDHRCQLLLEALDILRGKRLLLLDALEGPQSPPLAKS